MSAIVLELPIHTLSESNARGHWAKRAKRAKGQRAVVGLSLRSALAGLDVLPCSVMLTRIAPRALDDDNLRGATKACRDGVADALGVDDRDPRVTWLYAQARGKPKAYAVRVEVAPDCSREDASSRAREVKGHSATSEEQKRDLGQRRAT